MCEECDEVRPLYVARFRKAGGNIWRPPVKIAPIQQPDSAPAPSVNAGLEVQFCCCATGKLTERKAS
jgi:hypothetical protein